MTENERRSLPTWKRIVFILFSLIILSIQLSIFFFIGFYYLFGISTNYFIFVYLATELIAIGYVLYVIRKPINSSYKLIWSILILLLPVFFCILYSMNASSRRLSKRKRLKIHNAVLVNDGNPDINELKKYDSKGYALASVIYNDSKYACYKNTKYEFFANCATKALDMIEELKNAKRYIYMEFFIISPGKLMDEIIRVLDEKGRAGVKIRILYDSIGSKDVFIKKLVKRLDTIENCEIAQYEPMGINVNFMANYRDHRKITIIDGRVAYCGGDNLADEYVHAKERFGYWRDNCGKYEGRCIEAFVSMFSEMWYQSTKTIIPFTDVENNIESGSFVIPFGDGPLYDSHTAYDTFITLISSAERTLYISTPYFIIDETIISLIEMKAKCGVDVKILMPHIPDKKIPFIMGRTNYRDILKAGGSIYEYTPGFNHAKNIIVDNKYAFIGTVNFDYRSLFLHYECGAVIIDDPQIALMTEDYLEAVKESQQITYEKWKNRSIFEKLMSFILNLFTPCF